MHSTGLDLVVYTTICMYKYCILVLGQAVCRILIPMYVCTYVCTYVTATPQKRLFHRTP